MRDPDGKRILFWAAPRGTIDALADGLISLATGRSRRAPIDCVRTDIHRARRIQLVEILANGREVMNYMGHADCRMCGLELGSRDLYGHGFIWPEKAEHYILAHDVWTPECDELLKAFKAARATRGQR